MSFQQGLSGLNSTAANLDVIGNNIANANTYGAKSARAEFADLYAGAINGLSIGIGVNLANVSQSFTQGSITVTESPLDLAINGGGFFQVTDEQSPTQFSRNGQFKVDRDGFVVNNQGQKLMGYPADATGAIIPGVAQPLLMPTAAGLEPKVTEEITLALNLDARAPDRSAASILARATQALAAADAAVATNPSAANTATQIKATAAVAAAQLDVDSLRTIDVNDPSTYNNATSLSAYDSLGREVAVTFYFQRATDYTDPALPIDKWNVFVSANGLLLGQDTAPSATQVPATLTVEFSQGTSPTIRDATGAIQTNFAVTIPASSPPAEARLEIANVAIDLSEAKQFGTPFSVSDLKQDGFAPGQLIGFQVAEDGVIAARYSNGRTQAAGQVVIANFRNAQGLQPMGGNSWSSTFASGEPVPGTPGDGNLGVLQAGALEESNVDLTGELVNMITAQRSYQANAQTIKTQDQVLQTLVNLR